MAETRMSMNKLARLAPNDAPPQQRRRQIGLRPATLDDDAAEAFPTDAPSTIAYRITIEPSPVTGCGTADTPSG
jgi:hypothetical protein